RRKCRPVNLDVEVPPPSLQVFDDLNENWLRPLLINLGGGRREMLPHRFLRSLHQHGDKPGGGERHPDRPQPLVIDTANPERFIVHWAPDRPCDCRAWAAPGIRNDSIATVRRECTASICAGPVAPDGPSRSA